MTSLLAFLLLLAILLAVLLGLGAASVRPSLSADRLEEFRAINRALVEERFGPLYPSGGPLWHRVLEARDEKIVSRSVLWGLRQILWIEDQSGRHWRVVVANEMGGRPTLRAQQLGGEGDGA